jgi:hypothetical protein
VSSGASSRPVPYGGECRLKIVLSGEIGLVLLPVGLPRRRVGPSGRGHLEAVDLDDAPLRELDVLGLRDDRVDVELVVVPGTSERSDPGSLELLVGERHPALDGREHLLVEKAVGGLRVVLVLPQFVGIGAERVVAAPLDELLELRYLLLALEIVAVLEQCRVPASVAVVDDRDEGLAGHVAAEHDHVGLVVLPAVQKLAPAGLGAVNIGGEEEAHLQW